MSFTESFKQAWAKASAEKRHQFVKVWADALDPFVQAVAPKYDIPLAVPAMPHGYVAYMRATKMCAEVAAYCQHQADKLDEGQEASEMSATHIALLKGQQAALATQAAVNFIYHSLDACAVLMVTLSPLDDGQKTSLLTHLA